MKIPSYFIFSILIIFSSSVQSKSFESHHEPVVLIELYTSESCSSCPPAEHWLSQLNHHPDLWRNVFPLSFHVDYWNYLNWEDRFSQKKWSRRQGQLKRQGNIKSVYTPGFVTSGWEWHGWRKNQLPPRFYPEGKLSLHVSDTHASFDFVYQPSDSVLKVLGEDSQLTYHLALLGMGFKTHVQSGENKGRTLNQDFIVLDLKSQSSKKPRWTGKLPDSTLAKEAKQLAVVAWVSAGSKQFPLQVVGGWLIN